MHLCLLFFLPSERSCQSSNSHLPSPSLASSQTRFLVLSCVGQVGREGAWYGMQTHRREWGGGGGEGGGEPTCQCQRQAQTVSGFWAVGGREGGSSSRGGGGGGGILARGERGGLTHIWYTKRDLARSLFSSVRRFSLRTCPFFMRLSCCFDPHAGICPVDRLRAPAQRPVRARIVTYVAGNSAAGVSGAGAPSFYAEEGRKEGCFLCCVRRRRRGRTMSTLRSGFCSFARGGTTAPQPPNAGEKKFGCCISPWCPSPPPFCLDAVIAAGRWVVGFGREGGRETPGSVQKNPSTQPPFPSKRFKHHPLLLFFPKGKKSVRTFSSFPLGRKFEIICIERPSKGEGGKRNVMSAEKHPPETRLLQPLAQVCKNVRCLQKDKEKCTLFPLLLLGENSF